MKPRAWLVIACMALVGVLFLAGYPARSYLDQNDKRREMAAKVQTLESENRVLERRAQQLQTDAEIERLARKDYNLVRPGEEVYAVVPPDTTIPAPASPPRVSDRGWPQRALDWVTSIF